uniref:NADH-ubiquinone oxidoreductase chain 4 n=1 Tax=Cichlidogyrus sclerosus TaxID=341068 RepID=A0A3G0WYQ7_9PLAT|nr:NADH dehydrogenase subunit 4 [Cichlidogyrus sclerosus]
MASDQMLICSYLNLDFFGVYLSFITLLFVSFFILFWRSHMSRIEGFLICVSSVFSVLCFISNDMLLFWVTYELSILALVFCVLVGSPYSERFLAFWYLVGYVGSTSLPLLVSVLYVGVLGLSTSFVNNSANISGDFGFMWILFVILFATKVPLPPFHSWLPVVHAEASTFVSVCLSGFIMKLGIVGIYRFVLPGFSLSAGSLVLLVVYSSLVICSCLSELDTKRWLAYMSLGHIVVGVVGLFYGQDYVTEAPLYCLGHGFSASILFVLFLYLYESLGSRNWLSVSLSGRLGVAVIVILSLSLLTASSFPPSLNFFSEVFILNMSFFNMGLVLSYSLYLFVGGLVPVLALSYLLTSSGESFGSGVSTNSLLIVTVMYGVFAYLVVFFV